jgi:hypothetical protein
MHITSIPHERTFIHGMWGMGWSDKIGRGFGRQLAPGPLPSALPTAAPTGLGLLDVGGQLGLYLRGQGGDITGGMPAQAAGWGFIQVTAARTNSTR